MSYKFILVAQQPGADPEATVRAQLAQPETGKSPGPVEPQKEARKERLVELLKEFNPNLKASRPEPARAAEPNLTAEREARARHRIIEITDARNRTGVRITLRDDSAVIRVPFWHKRDEAGAVMDEIWGYLRILTEEGDMVAYDPQLDQVLKLTDDKLAVLKGYAGD